MPNAIIKTPDKQRIFVSYSHCDYKDALNLHMELEAICRRLSYSEVFMDCKGDGQLVAGEAWRSKILEALEQADVFVILLSSEFMASAFCRDMELKRALERSHSQPNVRVIGIALHKLNLKNFWIDIDGRQISIADKQVLPQAEFEEPTGPKYGLKPISLWGENRRRDAWAHVAEQLECALVRGHRSSFATAAQQVESETLPAVFAQASRLPYLCNRDDQYHLLVDSLARWQQSGCRRPLLLLTEGRQQDCLSAWIERLHQVEIAGCLEFKEKDLAFGHSKPLRWPIPTTPSSALTSAQEARQRFERAMASVMGPRPLANISEVFQAHKSRGRPVMLWTECFDRTHQDQATFALQGLVDVMSDSPDLDLGSMLVVAVNIIRNPAGLPNKRARLGPILAGVINEAAKRDGVCPVTLGSLTELDETAIRAWAVHDQLRGRLNDDIEMLYRKLPAGAKNAWPMLTFAETARTWIREH